MAESDQTTAEPTLEQVTAERDALQKKVKSLEFVIDTLRTANTGLLDMLKSSRHTTDVLVDTARLQEPLEMATPESLLLQQQKTNILDTSWPITRGRNQEEEDIMNSWAAAGPFHIPQEHRDRLQRSHAAFEDTIEMEAEDIRPREARRLQAAKEVRDAGEGAKHSRSVDEAAKRPAEAIAEAPLKGKDPNDPKNWRPYLPEEIISTHRIKTKDGRFFLDRDTSKMRFSGEYTILRLLPIYTVDANMPSVKVLLTRIRGMDPLVTNAVRIAQEVDSLKTTLGLKGEKDVLLSSSDNH
ncbi:hypothetical protein BDZ85DRAFT_286412 [Elsinoe ampelina]|uniref:Uncharacterized protein n=1 Tax=Elsinoe ampelina TaxID=302913 RepID=A0A6A6FYL0_9PEZI|nr:hypothetical protein BDZ85DRAFT_286412 [Elsinoe ampelina]